MSFSFPVYVIIQHGDTTFGVFPNARDAVEAIVNHINSDNTRCPWKRDPFKLNPYSDEKAEQTLFWLCRQSDYTPTKVNEFGVTFSNQKK